MIVVIMVWWETVIFILVILLMLGGLLGTVLPVIPGIPIIFLAALGYGIIEGFETITWGIIGILAILTGVSLLLDYAATVFGIKKMGGSYFGVAGAFAGMVVGFLAANLPGVIVGSFAGAVLGEMVIGKKSRQALRAGVGSFVGFVMGGVVKFTLGAVMIGIFVWNVLKG